ncbi:MAG: acylphosphatase [Chloroherpetonaceae bacterium]|nr:acylphosphatase [Chloroherpetonaceae bacterium]
MLQPFFPIKPFTWVIKMQRLHIIVQGRVQGVGFRWYTKDKADTHSINGWVKNLQNGDVEIEAEGNPNDINEFIQLVRKGPWGSFVSNLQITEQLPVGRNDGFVITR